MTLCLAFILAIYFLLCAVPITASTEQDANLSDMICIETAPVIVTYIVEKEVNDFLVICFVMNFICDE